LLDIYIQKRSTIRLKIRNFSILITIITTIIYNIYIIYVVSIMMIIIIILLRKIVLKFLIWWISNLDIPYEDLLSSIKISSGVVVCSRCFIYTSRNSLENSKKSLIKSISQGFVLSFSFELRFMYKTICKQLLFTVTSM